MMLNSLSHLKRVYEPKLRKVRKHSNKSKNNSIQSRRKLPAGFMYSGDSIIHKYHGKDMPHFGVLSGDILEINPKGSIWLTRRDALYAVQLRNGQTRICAIKYDGMETVLHNGLGDDFETHNTAFLTLIGEVTEAK